jgi:hypothetical protein
MRIGENGMPNQTGKYDALFRKNMLDQIRSHLAKEGYTVKSREYINNRTKLEIECLHHHTWWVTWDHIRSGKRCGECYQEGIRKKVPTRKPTSKNTSREQRRAQMHITFSTSLQVEGYVIQSGEYINNKTKISLLCPRGHTWMASWNQFSSGKRCKTCWIEDSRLTQEQVEKEFAAACCQLLEEYQGIEQKYKYRCSCGRVSYVRLPDFRKSVRCQACGGTKRRETLRVQRGEKLESVYLSKK